MTEFERLCDTAARLLDSEDAARGREQVDAIAKKLYARTCKFDTLRAVLVVSGAILATFAGIFVLNELSPAWDPIAGLVLLVSLSAAIWSFCAGRLVQTRRRFFVQRPYDIVLPEELETLLLKLASGELQAFLPAQYGSTAPGAPRTSDGELLTTQIVPRTFANRCAPLLLSSKPEMFAGFWMPMGKAFVRPIYVARQSEDLLASAADSNRPNTRSDAWLTSMSDERFKMGLPRYIATIEAHKQLWEKTVLVEGRRALRKGQNQKMAIAAIVEALREGMITNHGSAKGWSESTIKLRLQGKNGDADIERYFRIDEPQNS